MRLKSALQLVAPRLSISRTSYDSDERRYALIGSAVIFTIDSTTIFYQVKRKNV